MKSPRRRFKIEKLEERVVPGFMGCGCFSKSHKGGFGGFQSQFQSQSQAQFQAQAQSQFSSISISIRSGGTFSFTGGGSISIVL